LYRERFVYSGTSLLAELKCQEFSGRYKIFTRMAPTDFETLMILFGPKIVKSVTRMRTAIPVQDRCNFGPQATRAPVCNIRSKFLNKQSVRTYPKCLKLLLMH
jgi:hypothetical protein